MTEYIKRKDLLNLIKTCVEEITKPEYRKPLIATAALSIAIFGIMFAVRLISEGYTMIIKTGLVPVEVINTIVGGCACLIGLYLFGYFCIWPSTVLIRLLKTKKLDNDN